MLRLFLKHRSSSSSRSLKAVSNPAPLPPSLPSPRLHTILLPKIEYANLACAAVVGTGGYGTHRPLKTRVAFVRRAFDGVPKQTVYLRRDHYGRVDLPR